jgi:muconolactone D-isomerase
MEFLVEISVHLPPDLPSDQVDRLMAAERVRGAELRAAGTIQRIWRVRGGLRNVGIWNASDEAELRAAIESLPLAPYLEAEVTPLSVHPLEASEGE